MKVTAAAAQQTHLKMTFAIQYPETIVHASTDLQRHTTFHNEVKLYDVKEQEIKKSEYDEGENNV